MDDPIIFVNSNNNNYHPLLILLLQFMTKKPSRRLGCVVANGGEQAILIHPFFHHKIDWEALEERTVKPPFRPKIVSVLIKLANLATACVKTTPIYTYKSVREYIML